MVILAALGLWFRQPLFDLSRQFVQRFGGPGIALGFFVPDAFSFPFPNDAFGMFGLVGGLGFWQITAWATLGSIAGGSVGWLLGRALRSTAWFERFMSGQGRELEQLVLRNGILVVVVAAITPLPYSLSAWAAGAVRMPFVRFVLASTTRVIRVVGSLYLIRLGLFL